MGTHDAEAMRFVRTYAEQCALGVVHKQNRHYIGISRFHCEMHWAVPFVTGDARISSLPEKQVYNLGYGVMRRAANTQHEDIIQGTNTWIRCFVAVKQHRTRGTETRDETKITTTENEPTQISPCLERRSVWPRAMAWCGANSVCSDPHCTSEGNGRS